MTTQGFGPERAEWLRLRTLILLRWLAVLGQIAALVVAQQLFLISLPSGLCYLAVGLAVIVNLLLMYLFPVNKRLSEAEALITLTFDLTQLSLLLFLTGGLTNPFALLILAPVTVSALALELRSTVFLGALAIGFVTLFGLFNVALHDASGGVLQVPDLFKFGYWLSLIIGIGFLGIYSRRVATEMRSMADALLATQMALAREQKLTDLGGVVAAAAHELGTPLATIKLVSSEMIDELADNTDLQDDARLIRDQADRCRDILRSMGKAGKEDRHLLSAPLTAVIREAAEPHLARGKTVSIETAPSAGPEPEIQRRPELIHGLRNLAQNAVDFAKARVWITVSWTAESVRVQIIDDGTGFPSQIIGRIGDPFVRSRREPNIEITDSRPGYEGMGLGLFIAKTLLERTGAELTFANAGDPFLAPDERPDRSGAIVEVIWPMTEISVPRGRALGENIPIR
ncbi:sensor histidine kinase RegB [Fuscibacter oryzae]|uniref:histidine kinase n=1 Tax=Fuscibacter oryzae TaxID=2803939 RepID=A0A8J7SV08_9RHOB|nr:ActS/PrrB/RegB family redox-sensitive histidine kinase [Fuscibacter oryzae]MBL4929042.1 ActS/PrrB/RegB family redox-sensitive histidine kinase [Fuscibacter oryzae]